MRSTRCLLALAALAVSASTASAQGGTQSNGPVLVQLNATQPSTLTLSTSAASTTIASIAPGTTTDFPSLNVTATWNLTSGGNIALVGWFAVPNAALSGPGGNIAAGRVQGRTGGGAYQSFTNGPILGLGVGGGSAQLWNVAAAPLNGTATTNLDLRLNYTGQLPPNAGTYTGTLNLRAVIQ